MALPSDYLGPEQATRPIAAAGTAAVAGAATRVMPAAAPSPSIAHTTVIPGMARQATQRMPQQMPQRPVQMPRLPAPPQARQSWPQPQQYQANPADIKRGRYLAHSIAPLIFAAIVPAVAALFMPPAGIAAALLLFWVLLTIGFSTEAQLEREGKRGGIRKGSDTAMRILSLPWHAVRAAAHALLRTVWFALIDVIVVVIATVALQLPWQMLFIGDVWPHQIPYLTDGPLSLTGLAVSCSAAATWVLTAFLPKAPILRLGAGVLAGGPAGRNVPSSAIQST